MNCSGFPAQEERIGKGKRKKGKEVVEKYVRVGSRPLRGGQGRWTVWPGLVGGQHKSWSHVKRQKMSNWFVSAVHVKPFTKTDIYFRVFSPFDFDWNEFRFGSTRWLRHRREWERNRGLPSKVRWASWYNWRHCSMMKRCGCGTLLRQPRTERVWKRICLTKMMNRVNFQQLLICRENKNKTKLIENKMQS